MQDFQLKKEYINILYLTDQAKLSLNKFKRMAYKKKLDIKLMKIGGKKLLGTKDFATFRASNCGAKSPIKTLKICKNKKKGEKIEIKFKSKSF